MSADIGLFCTRTGTQREVKTIKMLAETARKAENIKTALINQTQKCSPTFFSILSSELPLTGINSALNGACKSFCSKRQVTSDRSIKKKINKKVEINKNVPSVFCQSVSPRWKVLSAVTVKHHQTDQLPSVSHRAKSPS